MVSKLLFIRNPSRSEHATHRDTRRPRTLPGPWMMTILLVSLLTTQMATAQGLEEATAESKPPPIGIQGASHLLGRTTFGAPLAELQMYATLNRDEAVKKLLGTLVTESSTPLPSWATLLPPDIAKLRGKTEQSRKAFQRESRRWKTELRSWWTRELISSPSPLTERLVLMWHGHFTSELTKVRSSQAMLRQNQMFRRMGSGDFRKLLHAVALDPAMSIYLDMRRSTREKPNENFARELLELYGLGEGNYTEEDIKEAARAFTGYRIDARRGVVRKIQRRHDRSEKTVLGAKGKFGATEVIDTVLAHEACPKWISRRFWIEFVSPTPDEEVLASWGTHLSENDWSLTALLEKVLQSDAFWNEDHRGALVKSPVDLVIGTIRCFELEDAPAGSALRTVSRLGQVLFDPPNVAGWPGGEQWIDATTLLGRRRFITAELQDLSILCLMNQQQTPPSDRAPGKEPESDSGEAADPQMDPQMEPPSDPGMVPRMAASKEVPRRIKTRDRRKYSARISKLSEKLWRQLGEDAMARSALIQQWLLPLDPVGQIVDRGPIRTRINSVLLDPTYQLK
ncbi:MAG: DUF1800 domain-containing protein [Planctomycetota bacterium]|nr:DUF1800 domain-containing protein [Planctomycetota bacterium]